MTLTAAEEAAKDFGYTMPEGTDRIRDGDDAIRNNGVIAFEARFKDGQTMPEGADLNNYNTPLHNGTHLLATASRSYVNAPPLPASPQNAMLFVAATPHDYDCWQRLVFRDNAGVWERYQQGPGRWTAWRDITSPSYTRHRETIPDGSDLSDYNTDGSNGTHQLSSTATYYGAPPDLVGPAQMFVSATGNRDTWQRITTRTGSAWERHQSGATSWSDWNDLTNQPYQRHPGVLADNSDLDDYWRPWHMGVSVLSSSSTYVNGPPRQPGETGMMSVVITGSADAEQTITYREGQGKWQRERINTSGRWTPWRDISRHAWDRLDGRLETLEASQGAPTTVYENSESVDPKGQDGWTSYWAGEAFLDRLGADVRTLGYTYNGRPIRAVVIGDDGNPVLLLQYTQHGSERAQREAAFRLARELTSTSPDWVDRLCVVIVPTVNADNVLYRRENDRGADLNRDWDDRSSREVTALDSFYSTLNIIAAIDGHEHDRPQSSALLSSEPVAGAAEGVNDMSAAIRTAAEDAITAGGWQAANWDNPSGSPEVFRNAAPLLYETGAVLIETPGGGSHMLPPEDRIGIHLAAAHAVIDYLTRQL